MGNPLEDWEQGHVAATDALWGMLLLCTHYPEHANRCLNPTYYGRYLPFDKPPHLWGGWAEMIYVDLEMAASDEDLPLAGRYVTDARSVD